MAIDGAETGCFGGSGMNPATKPDSGGLWFIESPGHARDVNNMPVNSSWDFFLNGGTAFTSYNGADPAYSYDLGGFLLPPFIATPPNPSTDPFRMILGPGWFNVPANQLSSSVYAGDYPVPNARWGLGSNAIVRLMQIMYPGLYECHIQVQSFSSISTVPYVTTKAVPVPCSLQIVSPDGRHIVDVTPSGLDVSGNGPDIIFQFDSRVILGSEIGFGTGLGFFPQINMGPFSDPGIGGSTTAFYNGAARFIGAKIA